MNKVKNFTPQDYIYKDILEMLLSELQTNHNPYAT